MGNIEKIYKNGELSVRYTYDKLNRLIREDNKAFGKTWLMTYDTNGNILYKKETSYTLKADLEGSTFTTADYWYEGQRLWRYNGAYIEYNGSDTRPYYYRDKSMAWAKGGQLASYNGHTFTYDTQGRRLTKDNITFTYDSQGRVVKQSNGLEFFYDHTGVVAVKYNGNMYFYRKDVQGNIVAIVDSSGWLMVEYNYDAWGRNTCSDESTVNLGTLNPFRYRGYYYDTETKLYYLHTRYYDPEIGRFISIDGIEYLDPETINGLNLYAYCNNNPVMNIDPNGTWSWKKFWRGVIGVATVIGATLVTAFTAGFAAAALGIALGVGNALVGATMIGAAIGGLVSGGMELISQGIASDFESLNLWGLAIESFTGAAYGAATGIIGSTTSVGTRLAMRGVIVATSGINAVLHGINQKKSFGDIMADIGVSMGIGLLLQGFSVGIDARRGKLSKTILESYAMDGFTFILRHKLSLVGVSGLKNLWRNRKELFGIVF